MKKSELIIFTSVFIFLIFSFVYNYERVTNPSNKIISTPIKKDDDKKWNISYFEGGFAPENKNILINIIKELYTIGWIDNFNEKTLERAQNTKDIWDWLTKECRSDYISFDSNLYFSGGYLKIKNDENESILRNYITNKNIDLIISMGNYTANQLNDLTTIPIVFTGIVNPEGFNLVNKENKTINSNWCVIYYPDRIVKAIEMFHDIFKFKTLGIVYENSDIGRKSIGIKKISDLAKIKEFKLEECYVDNFSYLSENKNDDILKCYTELIDRKIDAVYVFNLLGIPKNIQDIHKLFCDNNIPSMSQSNSYVKKGILMSYHVKGNHIFFGKRVAVAIAQILNGKTPSNISLELDTVNLVFYINTEIAKHIKWNIPNSILDNSISYKTIEEN